MYDIMREYNSRKVVIYARVSTEHEEQLEALENQIDWYKPIIAAHKEWILVKSYIDEGITGTSAKKRPQFLQMMRDAKNHKFDLIITREVSRFARNTVDTLQYTRMLRSAGVEVFFINDNIKTFDGDGELRLTIMATLAQDESRKTSVRVKAGQETSMRNGVQYGSGNILGYDRSGDNFVINPEQAKTVRMIFDMYLAGNGIKKIRHELERQGRLTSLGKTKWFDSVISKVLRNTTYCGIRQYHKSYTPDYLEQKSHRNDGKVMPYIYVKGNYEPIVSEEEFFLVQKMLKSRRFVDKSTSREWGHNEHGTALGKLLVCECGNKMGRITWKRSSGKVNYSYLCYSQKNIGTERELNSQGISLAPSCKTPYVPEWKLQLVAVRIFRDYIKCVDDVVNAAMEMLSKHINDDKLEYDNTAIIEAKKKELEKLNRRFDNLLEMRTDGEITKDVFLLKNTEIQANISTLESEIEKLASQQEEKVTMQEVDERLTELKQYIEACVDFENMNVIPDNVLEAFIEKIVIHEDGSMDWYLKTSNNSSKYYEDMSIEKFEDILNAIEQPEITRKAIPIAEFDVGLEDAKNYLYADSTRHRVHNWKNTKVRLIA